MPILWATKMKMRYAGRALSLVPGTQETLNECLLAYSFN